MSRMKDTLIDLMNNPLDSVKDKFVLDKDAYNGLFNVDLPLGMDDCYYFGLKYLYGIGTEPDLEMAMQLLNKNVKYLHDFRGITNIYPEMDFYAWGQEVYSNKTEIDTAEIKGDYFVEHKIKLALTYLRLFNGSDIVLKEVFYQQQIGRIGVDEVKNIIVQNYGKEALNPYYNPERAFAILNLLEESTDYDFNVLNGLGIYLKAHCFENGIGVEKNVEEAIRIYGVLAKRSRSIYRRNAIYKILELCKVINLDVCNKLSDAYEEAREDFKCKIHDFDGCEYYDDDIEEVFETGEEYPERLTDISLFYEDFESTTARYIVKIKYSQVEYNSKYDDLDGRETLFDTGKYYEAENCSWNCDLGDVPDSEMAIAHRLVDLNAVSCGTYAGKQYCTCFDGDEEDEFNFYSRRGVKDLPYNIYLNVEFYCPKMVNGNPQELSKFKSPIDYLLFLLRKGKQSISYADELHHRLRTYTGNRSRLIIGPVLLNKTDFDNCEDYDFKEGDYYDLIDKKEDFEQIPEIDKSGPYSEDGLYQYEIKGETEYYWDCYEDGGFRYRKVGSDISLAKDRTCDCKFKYCPFKLAAYLKYNDIYEKRECHECEKRKYDFKLSVEDLDFFCLSDQELENAKSLAEEGLVYIEKEGEQLNIVNWLLNPHANNWEELNDNSCAYFPYAYERMFSAVNANDSYETKILEAAAIWSYIIANNISINNLRKILLGGLNDAVKVLQKPDIDYYYGAVTGTSDDCELCCSYIKGKLKDVSKKAYKFEEITLEDFCKQIIGNEDFDKNFSKIEGFSDELYSDESHKKDESRGEPTVVFGGYTLGSGLINNSNILNTSSPSENDTTRNNRGDTKPEKTVYMINGLHYRPDSKKANDVNNFNKAIELLCNIMRSKYIILCGSRKEVENIIKIDERLEWLFRNNIVELISDLSWKDEFDKFIKSLPKQFWVGSHLVNYVDESELRYKFAALFSDAKLPFKPSELAVFLRNYCIVNDSLEFPSFKSSEDINKEWDEVIGMKELKAQWKRIEKLIAYNQRAKLDGKQIISSNRHMMFLGNPGVGKTKIARLMAKTLFDIGAISKEKIVEVDRKDLVAEHIGQTAIKTAKVIEEADGGVLFIDEAYSLYAGGNDFGQEAVSTLIKAMEDRKDSLIVIFAGYKDEMENKFIPMNPGLSSRIRFKLYFDDYDSDALVSMFINKVKKHGLSCDDESKVKEKVKNIMDNARENENFGFGRYVDKLFDETMMNHAERVLVDNGNDEYLYVITVEDIPENCV